MFSFPRLFWTWLVLGALGGFFAGIYWNVLSFITRLLGGAGGVWMVIFMTLAGLLAGLVIHYLGEPGEISLVVDNIRFNNGQLDAKRNPSMVLSSLLCIGSGGSAGPEAPLVQVTGSLGSWWGKKLKLKGEEFRSMTIAGVAAGFTALFGAPLGGSFFALEILHHEHVAEYFEALIPAFVASCASYIVFAMTTNLGFGPTWRFPQIVFPIQLHDYATAILYGVVGALAAWVFIGFFNLVKLGFGKVKMPIFVSTAAGGFLLGMIAWVAPLSRYFGHDQMVQMIRNIDALDVLLLLIVLKLVAISITVVSGWRGGIIIPLFFVGACVGKLIVMFVPDANSALTIVCVMAAINAAVTKTPVSTTLLLASLTSVHQMVPIFFASLTGFFLSPKAPFIKSQISRLS